VAALPPRQRVAVTLRYFVDLSEADTATAMGCSRGSVKSYTSRGVAALRSDARFTEHVRREELA
jgi:DNA-directed RNA polymerase specialized sigma24 family protein